VDRWEGGAGEALVSGEWTARMEKKMVELESKDGEKTEAQAFRDVGGWWLDSNEIGRHGVVVYDPHFYHTACCQTAIVHADGCKGKLYYRGHDMEELAEKSSFIEVAYLLMHGKLPTGAELVDCKESVMNHTYLHEDLLFQIRSFRYDAHPMGIMISTMASLSTFYPDANPSLQGADLYANSDSTCEKQMHRILAKVTTIAACAYRVRVGRAFNSPSSEGAGVSYTENFLMMLDRQSGETGYKPDPQLCRMLDKLFVALADDGMNTATALMRHVCSSKVDPYTAIAASFAALYGARVSGVGDAVLEMLKQIGDVNNVGVYLKSAKARKVRLQGFGHLLYKAYDPRCRVVKKIALEVAELMGEDPLLPIAMELEKQVLADSFFAARRVWPNMDLYLSLVVRMMGFPQDFFSVVVSVSVASSFFCRGRFDLARPFCLQIPRTAGFLAHWFEFVHSPKSRIARPRQVYRGREERPYRCMKERDEVNDASNPEPSLEYDHANHDRRRAQSMNSSTVSS